MTKYTITATIRDKKGRLLSAAVNNYTKSHPIQAKFARNAKQPSRIYLHAEIAALVKLKKGDRPESIHIERKTKDGTYALAAPCPVCRAALTHWGIKRIFYT